MTCTECNGTDCVGQDEIHPQYLDIHVDYRASDCKIDNDDSPWWVEVEINSIGGNSRTGTGGVKVQITLDSGPEISIVGDDEETKYIPGNSSGRIIDFKIEQVKSSHPPKMEKLELDIDWDEGNPYEDLEDLELQRRLSSNP